KTPPLTTSTPPAIGARPHANTSRSHPSESRSTSAPTLKRSPRNNLLRRSAAKLRRDTNAGVPTPPHQPPQQPCAGHHASRTVKGTSRAKREALAHRPRGRVRATEHRT